MKTTEVKANWKEHKSKLKKKFALLTDNEEGKREEMFGKLQLKFGKTREELHKIIDSL